MITGTRASVRTEKRWIGLRPPGLTLWTAKLTSAVKVISPHQTYPAARWRIVPLGRSSCEMPSGKADSTVARCATTAALRRSGGRGAEESTPFRSAAVASRKTTELPTTATAVRPARRLGGVESAVTIAEQIH